MIADVESYLAGVFDGEGSISVKYERYGKRREHDTVLTVQVKMTDVAPLLLFQERFGGAVKTYRRSHHWYVGGNSARAALDVFSSMCLVKAEEAKLGLAMADLLAEVGRVRGKREKGKRCVSETNATLRALVHAQFRSLRSQQRFHRNCLNNA